MKKMIGLLFVVSAMSAFALKCPECLKAKKKSEVIPKNCIRHITDCDPGHWDENGKFLQGKDCNETVCDFSCTKGHKFHGSVEELEAKQAPPSEPVKK